MEEVDVLWGGLHGMVGCLEPSLPSPDLLYLMYFTVEEVCMYPGPSAGTLKLGHMTLLA